MFGILLQKIRKAIERALGFDGIDLNLSSNAYLDLFRAPADQAISSGGIPRAMLERIMTMDMPGESYSGTIELSVDEIDLRRRLQRHVTTLASEIGIRNTEHPAALEQAANYVEAQLRDLGLRTWNQHYITSDGHASRNIEATLVGTDPDSSLIIGAHYDSVDCPGANDNASGVACLLEIARCVTERESPPRSTLRFVGFTNEEPPYFYTGDMGSRVYAQEVIDRREQVLGMICLETIAYYSDERGSQMIPPILRPFFDHNVGDFIGFFSNNESRDFLRNVVGAFRRHAEVPSEGLAAPSVVQGLDFSDHASFWRVGYNAVMVTDTAFMRYKHYHRSSDTPDKLEWTRFTKVTDGLTKAVMELSGQFGR